MDRRALFGWDALEDGVQPLDQPDGLAMREGERCGLHAPRVLSSQIEFVSGCDLEDLFPCLHGETMHFRGLCGDNPVVDACGTIEWRDVCIITMLKADDKVITAFCSWLVHDRFHASGAGRSQLWMRGFIGHTPGVDKSRGLGLGDEPRHRHGFGARQIVDKLAHGVGAWRENIANHRLEREVVVLNVIISCQDDVAGSPLHERGVCCIARNLYYIQTDSNLSVYQTFLTQHSPQCQGQQHRPPAPLLLSCPPGPSHYGPCL